MVAASPPVIAMPPQRIAEAVNAQLRARVVQVGITPTAGPPVLTSGFPVLDEATGLGGFPCGRITELIGRPTSGREVVAAHTVASASGHSAWVDVPGLIDIAYLAQCGADLDRLFILRPQHATEALAIAARLLADGHFRVVVLDALADLAPGGATACDVAQFIRVVTPALGRSTTAALILSAPENHYRPLAHAAALRISLAKIGLLRRGGVFRGWRTRARILKSPGLQGGEPGIEVWL
jgi:recombination protein RecA